jgi:hypothetical protein
MYSIADLLDIFTNNKFVETLTNIVQQYSAHVQCGKCDLCFAKAHYCTMLHCKEHTKPIFPFQLTNIVMCGACGALFHRLCFSPNQNCASCSKLDIKRRVKEEEQRKKNKYSPNSSNNNSSNSNNNNTTNSNYAANDYSNTSSSTATRITQVGSPTSAAITIPLSSSASSRTTTQIRISSSPGNGRSTATNNLSARYQQPRPNHQTDTRHNYTESGYSSSDEEDLTGSVPNHEKRIGVDILNSREYKRSSRRGPGI